MKKTTVLPKLPHLTLNGDIKESFYQLGLKDSADYQQVSSHLLSLISKNTFLTKQLMGGGLQLLAQKVLRNDLSLKTLLEPYSEGLAIPLPNLISLFLIPETLSCVHQFLPYVPSNLFGCSSFFVLADEDEDEDEDEDKNKNEKKSKRHPVHGRILDFPLVGTYEKYQRTILYAFPQLPKIWSYSLVGLPYPCLTSMNDEGMTLSLHQKFSKSLFPDGSLAFEIAWRIISEAHNRASALKILKKSKGLTTWGFYMSFKNGEVLTADLSGNEVVHKNYLLTPGKPLYFNNTPIKKDSSDETQNCIPLGMNNFCKMRRKSANEKISQLQQKDKITDLDLIKVMARPLSLKASSAKNWHLDVITFNTINMVTLNPSLGKTLFIPGPAPKTLSSKVLEILNIWDEKLKPSTQFLSTAHKNTLTPYIKGLRCLGKTSAFYDMKDLPQAFHHIQMSIEHLAGYPEKFIAEFYFLVFQYIQYQNSKDLPFLLGKFQSLEEKLPSYLNDHRLLFLMRLEKIQGLHPSVSSEKFSHSSLQKIFHFERKLPPLILKNLRSLIFPQLGILDIIYGYKDSANN